MPVPVESDTYKQYSMPSFTLRGNLCMNPGSNYIVRIRGLNARNEPVTDWFEGKKFTVAESGCAQQSTGYVGVCTTRELCDHRGHDLALSPHCDYVTGDVGCCAPNTRLGKPGWFAKDFEFTSPHGDAATIYSTDKLKVEWQVKDDADLPARFSLHLVPRGGRSDVVTAAPLQTTRGAVATTRPVQPTTRAPLRGNRQVDLATNVPLSAGSFEVPSFQVNGYAVGKYDLAAVFWSSRGSITFRTPLELLPTPCRNDPGEDFTIVGTCQATGTCGSLRSLNFCGELGSGITCCFDNERDNSYGFKDNSNTLPDSSTTNAVSLMLLSVCAVVATLF